MERLLLETVPFRNDSFNKNTSVCFTCFFSGDEKQIEMREKTLMIVVNRAEWQMWSCIRLLKHRGMSLLQDFSLSSKNKKGLRR